MESKKVKGGSEGGVSPLFIGIFVVVLAGFAWSSYSYIQVKQEITFLSTPEGQEEANTKLVEETLKDVGKLIVLPDEDSPFVFTIQNAEELAAQEAFYTNASNGDRLIVFSDRAIIYSPSRDILINVGPVIFQSAEDGEAQPAPPPPAPSEEEGEEQ